VIQAAAEHAIRKGITMAGALNRIRKLRESSDTPIVFFSYFNPIHKYGQDRFIAEAVESGVNALLITDMPPEESNGLKTRAEKAGMAWIHLITPTTPRNRILQLDASGSGFLYYVSVLGVTGESRDKMRRDQEHGSLASRSRLRHIRARPGRGPARPGGRRGGGQRDCVHDSARGVESDAVGSRNEAGAHAVIAGRVHRRPESFGP
jgi:tryptophan synthase alpha subunit